MAMAQAADPSLPDDPDQQKEPPSLARETVLLSLLSYEDLFEDIDNNNRPQGDVRPRYLRLRAIRGNYLNAQVNETGREYDEFRKKVRDKILDSSTKEVQDAFKQLMAKMDRDLDRCSA
jgi:hypothetical protein